jgi:4-carboxymuconolactone decarboxylase
MTRIPLIDSKEPLAAEHQGIYDAIAKSRGTVRGPFLALLHSPELARRTADLGAFVRFESELDPKTLELATLVVAREADCSFEWAVHVEHAAEAGVPRETIRAILERKAPEGLSADDAQIVIYVHELLRAHRVSEPTFQTLIGRLGVRGLVELTAAIGYYAMLACTLNAFELAPDKLPPDLQV